MLFIIDENNEVHLVIFHSQTFIFAELNYDTYDKKLLAIFEAFRIWYHYFKNLASLINVVTNHKNLKYFFTTKILIYRQAKYFEFFFLTVQPYYKY